MCPERHGAVTGGEPIWIDGTYSPDKREMLAV